MNTTPNQDAHLENRDPNFPGTKSPAISAFFPAYNDAGTIGSMVIATLEVLRRLTPDFEVIVVNDGSTDHTATVLNELERLYPGRVRIIHHPGNLGYGAALRTGFSAAIKEWIFYTDGDAQYDPLEISRLIPAMLPEIDIVNGYKISRNDPWYRIIIGRLYHHLVRFSFNLKLQDIDCDFRLIRKKVFDRVQLKSCSGTICVEMIKKFQDNKFRIAEVPVHHYHRTYGQSQFFNFKRLFKTGVDLLNLWFELVILRKHLAFPQCGKKQGPLPAANNREGL